MLRRIPRTPTVVSLGRGVQSTGMASQEYSSPRRTVQTSPMLTD